MGLCKYFWCFLKATFRALFSCCFRRPKRPDLSADVCVVTGAGQGLGRHLALQLAKCGGTLVLWDVDEEKVRSVAGEIREGGRDAHPYVVDCSKREEVYRVAAQVREDVGDVAVLVNNAGISFEGPESYFGGGVSDEQVTKTFSVNILAHFWTVKAFLPWMMENDYGYIVNVASQAAFVGHPYITAYAATKAAVRSFSESLRYELLHNGKRGISITCAYPPPLNTNMISDSLKSALKKRKIPIVPPEDVAETVVCNMGKKNDVLFSQNHKVSMLMKSLFPQAVDILAMELGDMFKTMQKKRD